MQLGESSAEVRHEFAEASHLGEAGARQMAEKLGQHPESSPLLSAGDVDAAWEDAAVGGESAGGNHPSPDQEIVDELGEAMGVGYLSGEPLHTTEKVEARDEHRWELDPASSEGFVGRMKNEGTYEGK